MQHLFLLTALKSDYIDIKFTKEVSNLTVVSYEMFVPSRPR